MFVPGMPCSLVRIGCSSVASSSSMGDSSLDDIVTDTVMRANTLIMCDCFHSFSEFFLVIDLTLFLILQNCKLSGQKRQR